MLVDEIAADTDPREGAALAAAILEALVERGAAVLVTTHLDELKALALTDPRYANARVGFDAERLQPDLPAPPRHRPAARPRSRSRRASGSRRRWSSARAPRSAGRAARSARRSARSTRSARGSQPSAARRRRPTSGRARRRSAPRAAEEAARRAEREAAARMGEALADDIDAARAEVAELLAGLQAQPSVKAATEAQRQLEAWRATVAGAARTAQAQAEAGPEASPGGEVKPGVRVRIVSLGQEGEVVEVDGETRARPRRVRSRSAARSRISCRCVERRRTPRLAKTPRRAARRRGRGAAGRAPAPRSDGSTCAGCGSRSCSARWSASSTRATREGEAECLILHGHGTGALKQALRDHLSSSPYVGAFRAGDRHEGGDAVTVVSLRR